MLSLPTIFREIFESMWSHRLRSFLTMFGIAWGVASLLLLVGLGEGFRSGNKRGLAELGSDVIMIFGGTIPAVPNQHTGMRPYKVTLSDERAVVERSPHVRASTAVINRGDLKEVSEFSSAGGPVWGVEANYPQIRNLPLASGRLLDQEDVDQHRHVIVLGSKNATLLFPENRRPLGAYITVNGERFLVIGVAGPISRGNNNTDNQKVYLPLSVMLQDFPIKGDNIPADSLSGIDYQPRTENENEIAKLEVHRVIAARHGFSADDPDAFDEWDTIKSNRMVGIIFTAMDLFLGSVGVVTLALGAVGIVNIMLVVVAERTREIGLRKALGATNRSITLQFFLEGLALTGISGGIGIAAAAGLMALMNAGGHNAQGFDPPRLVPWSVFMAVGTLMLAGIIAGVYPARKAAQLEPVEALRRD